MKLGKSSIPITPAQSRMARIGLGLTREEIAQEAKIARNTVVAFENGHPVRDSTRHYIQLVLEKHGAKFAELGKEVSVTVPKTE